MSGMFTQKQIVRALVTELEKDSIVRTLSGPRKSQRGIDGICQLQYFDPSTRVDSDYL